MKITGFLYSAPPLRWVGGEIMTLRLLSHAAANGHDVSVVVQTLSEPKTYNGVSLIPGHHNGYQPAVKAFNRADVIVTHPELVTRPPRFTASVSRIPWIGLVHNTQPTTLRGLELRPAMHVVANTSTMANALREKHGFGGSLSVIYPPIPRIPPPALALPSTFASQVSLSPEKGVKTFLSVVGALPSLPFLAVVGGHGEQEAAVTHLDNVTLFGHGKMALPYALTRVLLAPSKAETYGMVVGEATVLGIPVIASDISGHREVLGEHADLLPVDDPKPWIERCRTLMTDKDAWKAAHKTAQERGEQLKRQTTSSYRSWLRLLDHIARTSR